MYLNRVLAAVFNQETVCEDLFAGVGVAVQEP
jgi:tRNA G37 N-methylase Trm5